MSKKEFVDSTKNEKIFRYVNIALTIAMAMTGVALAIYYKVAGDPNERFFPSLGMLLYCAIPFLFELITRSKLPNSVFLIFNIYVAIAGLWGSALFLIFNIYVAIAGLWGSALSGYKDIAFLDIIVHFVMGYLISVLGFFFLCRNGENKKMNKITILLFCVFFSLFIESAWELSERTLDLILKIDIQGEWVAGTNAPLLTDTIEDIACNMGGALLFGVHFALSLIFKKDFGILSMEKEFATRHRLFEKKNKDKKITEEKEIDASAENEAEKK